eukprot:4797918-Pyramimonas_sp.AAC.1
MMWYYSWKKHAIVKQMWCNLFSVCCVTYVLWTHVMRALWCKRVVEATWCKLDFTATIQLSITFAAPATWWMLRGKNIRGAINDDTLETVNSAAHTIIPPCHPHGA